MFFITQWMSNFQVLDFIFKQKEQVFTIQVTFSKEHAKKASVFDKLYERLGMQKQDKLIVYIITNPEFAEKYGKQKYEDFIKHQKNDRLNVEFQSVRSYFTLK